MTVKRTYKTTYKQKLDNFREILKELSTDKNCIDLLEDLVTEIANTFEENATTDEGDLLSEVIYRTLSKDLSRYYESFNIYQETLDLMGDNTLLKELRRKLVTTPNFFDEIWKEESDRFFNSRKFVTTYVKDQKVVIKFERLLNCICTGTYRYLIERYG